MEKVWGNYEDVRRWAVWDESLTSVNLSGDFENGTKGVMFNQGLPELPFELTEVVRQKSFTTKSVMGPFVVEVNHRLIKGEDGLVTVEHGVLVNGPDEGKVQEVGQGVLGTFPNALKKLEELS